MLFYSKRQKLNVMQRLRTATDTLTYIQIFKVAYVKTVM